MDDIGHASRTFWNHQGVAFGKRTNVEKRIAGWGRAVTYMGIIIRADGKGHTINLSLLA
jgi:hypothetical protein